MTEQHAEHDRGQHLEIEALKERPVVGGQFSCCGLSCHRRLFLSFLRTFPVLARGISRDISSANANGGIAVLHPIHGPCRLVGPCQASKCGDWPRMTFVIENYLGFPTGISGMALMARAYIQAQNSGAGLRSRGAAVQG